MGGKKKDIPFTFSFQPPNLVIPVYLLYLYYRNENNKSNLYKLFCNRYTVVIWFSFFEFLHDLKFVHAFNEKITNNKATTMHIKMPHGRLQNKIIKV